MVGDGVLPLQFLITSSRLELGKELFPGGRLVQSFLRLPSFGSASLRRLGSPEITRWPDHQRSPEITRSPDHNRSPEITRSTDHQITRGPSARRRAAPWRECVMGRRRRRRRDPDPAKRHICLCNLILYLLKEHNIKFPVYLLQINFFHTSSCSIGRVDHLRWLLFELHWFYWQIDLIIFVSLASTLLIVTCCCFSDSLAMSLFLLALLRVPMW